MNRFQNATEGFDKASKNLFEDCGFQRFDQDLKPGPGREVQNGFKTVLQERSWPAVAESPRPQRILDGYPGNVVVMGSGGHGDGVVIPVWSQARA